MPTGEMIRGRRSYMQLGGNALGYSFLILLIGAGMLAAGSAQDSTYRRVLFIRLAGSITQCTCAIAAGWCFGIAFAPGGVAAAGIGRVVKLQQG